LPAPGKTETIVSPIGAPSTIEITTLPPADAALPHPQNYAPHIALILPLNSPSSQLSSAANIVQQGFVTSATHVTRDFPVRIYSATDESKEVINIYRQAIANGAVAVAGPLTRPGVTLLSSFSGVTVPTLALNNSEQSYTTPKMYFFGLNPESEARQSAQMAFAAKLNNVTIINTGTYLSKRLAIAFADEWQKLGGNLTAEITFREGDDTSVLQNLPTAPWLVEPPAPTPITLISESGEVSTMAPKRTGPPPAAPGNVVFLASDNKQARMIRPYLNPSLPVYSTSQLFNVNADTLTNYDLNDIRFMDMPWLLQPDHPAVMVYPHAEATLDTDKERLYAFGIDAYRLLNIMLNEKYRSALPLDGVTGRISLAASNTFQRDAVPAFFRYGRALTRETLALIEAERAAAKAAEIAERKAAADAAAASTTDK
jgi:hypothetical protein